MHAQELDWLFLVCLLLAAGIVAVFAARLLRVTPIVGYLAFGALLGPFGLGWIEDGEALRFLAEFGVAFLMFDIGLHFSIKGLWDTRHQLFGLGPVQFLLTGIPLILLLTWFDVETTGAVFVGLALALSSTAVVLQAFAERKQRETPLGRTVTAVLIFQDLAAVLLLAAIGAVMASAANPVADLSFALLKIVAAFAVVAVLGRAIRPLFHWIVQREDEATFIAAALLLVLMTAGFTAAIGLSLALGAFLAGMALSESEYCYRVKTELRPFRGLFLGLFFLTIGMSLDSTPVLDSPGWVLVLLGAFLSIKLIAGIAAALALRQPPGFAVRLSFSLAQGSEFAFVIIALALAAGLLTADMASVIIVVIVVSMIATGGLITLGGKLGRRWQARFDDQEDAVGQDESTTGDGRVIISGMDDAARAVATAFHGLGVEYLALETDGRRLRRGRTDGYRVAHGDPLDFDLLQTLGLASAKALIMGETSGQRAVDLIRRVNAAYPELPILVRALDAKTAGDAATAGADVCVRTGDPDLEHLAVETLRKLGVDEARIERWQNDFRPSEFERADKAHQLTV